MSEYPLSDRIKKPHHWTMEDWNCYCGCYDQIQSFLEQLNTDIERFTSFLVSEGLRPEEEQSQYNKAVWEEMVGGFCRLRAVAEARKTRFETQQPKKEILRDTLRLLKKWEGEWNQTFDRIPSNPI